MIQIGSVEGLQVPLHETYAYSSSKVCSSNLYRTYANIFLKAALHHLSRHLAGRLGWEGITSNTIACGMLINFLVHCPFDLILTNPEGPFQSKSECPT